MKIIAISGPSCSGKSTISQNLLMQIPGSFIVHQDDFYLPDSRLPQTNGVANWDCPEAFEMDRFASVVHKLHSGVKEQYKTYEKPDVEVIDHRLPNLEPVAIIEGIMLFQQNSPLLKEFDAMFFTYEDKQVLKERRATRTYDTVEGEWADPPGYFDEIVWPEFEKNYGYLIDTKDGQVCASAAADKLGVEFLPQGSLEEMFEWVGERLEKLQR